MKETTDENGPQLLREKLHEQLKEYVELNRIYDDCRQALWQFFGLPGYEAQLTKERHDEIKAKVKDNPILNSLYLAQTLGVNANGR